MEEQTIDVLALNETRLDSTISNFKLALIIIQSFAVTEQDTVVVLQYIFEVQLSIKSVTILKTMALSFCVLK